MALLGLTVFSGAQAQSADDILNKVSAIQKAARDVTFSLKGSATLDAGQTQKLDLDVQSIPASNLTRLLFNAPDALADNIVILDSKEVRQYLYLSNQITVTPLNKAAQGRGVDLGGLDFNSLSNPAALKSRYDLKLLGSTGTAGNRTFQLQATPKTGSAGKTVVWIAEQGWQPSRLQVYGAGGKVMADVSVVNYKKNVGLTASKLRALPKDAEVIKQ